MNVSMNQNRGPIDGACPPSQTQSNTQPADSTTTKAAEVGKETLQQEKKSFFEPIKRSWKWIAGAAIACATVTAVVLVSLYVIDKKRASEKSPKSPRPPAPNPSTTPSDAAPPKKVSKPKPATQKIPTKPQPISTTTKLKKPAPKSIPTQPQPQPISTTAPERSAQVKPRTVAVEIDPTKLQPKAIEKHSVAENTKDPKEDSWVEAHKTKPQGPPNRRLPSRRKK